MPPRCRSPSISARRFAGAVRRLRRLRSAPSAHRAQRRCARSRRRGGIDRARRRGPYVAARAPLARRDVAWLRVRPTVRASLARLRDPRGGVRCRGEEVGQGARGGGRTRRGRDDDGFRVLQAVPGATLRRSGRRAPVRWTSRSSSGCAPGGASAHATDGVPAYVVMHDATLRDLAAARPASLQELAGVKGFGPTKIERYGEDVLAVVALGSEPAAPAHAAVASGHSNAADVAVPCDSHRIPYCSGFAASG